jgi:transposase
LDVDIGIDSHKRSFSAVVVDDLGRVIGVRDLPNTPTGFAHFERWAAEHGDVRRIGIEGTGSYGAGLARHLCAHGFQVVEVPAFLAHRERKRAPAKGKSDAADAISIARVVARGEGLSPVRHDPVMSELRLLSDHRDQLVCARTQIANRIHKLLAAGYPGYEARIPNLTSKAHVAAVGTLLRGDRSVRAELVRDQVAELGRLDHRIATVTKQLSARVLATETSLLGLHGVGIVTAARILGEVGHRAGVGTRSSFAMFTGTAPLEASSGATRRHRLNRGGNRKLNCALHTIALTCARSDPETKAYLARQKGNGKTGREAMRSLKRHLSNVVHRTLVYDFRDPRMAA